MWYCDMLRNIHLVFIPAFWLRAPKPLEFPNKEERSIFGYS